MENILDKYKPKDYNISQEVEAVSGVCFLIRREVVEKVGLLDEGYYMYAEEQDYCYRIQKAGWKILYCPIESIIHYKEPDDTNKERVLRQYIYGRRNLVLFLYKHFGFCHALLLAVLFFLSNSLKVVFSGVTGKDKSFYNSFFLSTLFSEFRDVLRGKQTTD